MFRQNTARFERVVGVGMLVLACVAWGSSFPAIKIIVGSLELDPAAYTALRSLLTLAVIAPFMLRRRLHFSLPLLLVGLSYALGMYLQGLGTAYTTASNSAFITSLHMVFVYMYEAFKMRKIVFRTLATIMLAAVGVYLLVGGVEGVRIGDLIVLISSVFWASQVILVSRLSKNHSVVELLFWQLLIATLLFTPSTVASLDTTAVLEAMPGLVYLALVPGLLAFSLQILGQRRVEAVEASIVYTLEPLFAAIFSNLILGETLDMIQAIGALLILASTLLVALGEASLAEKRENSGKLAYYQHHFRGKQLRQ